MISRDPTLLLQVPDATNKKFASLPCDFPHFRHLGNSCGSHSPTLCETNSEIWNLNTSSTKGIARKTVQSFQCISGRFGNDRGMVHLDLAGVHHDPHPLSHGLRRIICKVGDIQGLKVRVVFDELDFQGCSSKTTQGRVFTWGGRLRANLARTEPALPWGRVT